MFVILKDVFLEALYEVEQQLLVWRRQLLNNYCRQQKAFSTRNLVAVMDNEQAEQATMFLAKLRTRRPSFKYADLARFIAIIFVIASNKAHRWQMEEALERSMACAFLLDKDIKFAFDILLHVNGRGTATVQELWEIGSAIPGFIPAEKPAKGMTAWDATERYIHAVDAVATEKAA